ncbi:MAG: RNA 2',3'-cyclic phosphodiesterase [Chloroflexi bacterium]|nr:RNA 2',3'-cyclic phosphodiesterase [Chloroflexota bacterium]
MPERTARLFVGIDLDAVWMAGLTSAADMLREPVGDRARFVRPELYHVTVVFLGDQSESDQEAAGQALRETVAQSAPFELHMAGIQHLGGHEHGALVAALQDPSGDLQRLRQRLDEALRRRRVRFDAKLLTPHITLARPKRRSGPLPIAPMDLSDAPPLRVNAVSLLRSFLQPTGPRYQSLMKLRLTGG